MPGEIFAEVSKTHNLVEKLAARAKLKNDVIVLFCFGEIDELDDIWMVDFSHDLNFFENV